jgi:hypothetical protein
VHLPEFALRRAFQSLTHSVRKHAANTDSNIQYGMVSAFQSLTPFLNACVWLTMKPWKQIVKAFHFRKNQRTVGSPKPLGYAQAGLTESELKEIPCAGGLSACRGQDEKSTPSPPFSDSQGTPPMHLVQGPKRANPEDGSHAQQ